jgi:hypothetical protein
MDAHLHVVFCTVGRDFETWRLTWQLSLLRSCSWSSLLLEALLGGNRLLLCVCNQIISVTAFVGAASEQVIFV